MSEKPVDEKTVARMMELWKRSCEIVRPIVLAERESERPMPDIRITPSHLLMPDRYR